MKRVQPRTPAGVPTGGEFASKTHGEADISLVGAPPASGRTVEAFELAFQQGSSDKFYRVFVWEDDAGGHAVVQYGRTGTSGTAKQTDYPDGAAASAFAAKQLKAKKAKGYLPTAESAFDLDVIDIDDGPVSPLDLEAAFNRNRGAATELVADATADDAAKAAAAAERMASLAVDSDWQPTATEEDVRRALVDFEMDNTAELPEMVPQLADTVPKMELAAHLDNPAWVAQRKLDGDRMAIRITDGTVEVLNRHGQPKTTNITAGIVATFSPLKTGTWAFDGEVVGQRLHLFDMPHADGYVDQHSGFDRRHAALEAAVGALDSPHVAVLSHTGGDPGAKRELLDQVKAEKGEGIILRRADAQYRHGTRGAGLLKHKFTNGAETFVHSVDPTKESVTLAVRDRSGVVRVVGKASTIGKTEGRAFAQGDVVEVEFAHVLDPANPVMVQPRITRRRTDKLADECSLDQFADAGTVKDVPVDG